MKEAEPIPTEVIAESIVKISDGVQAIRAGRLNEKALVILLHHSTGIAQREIKCVLNGLASLKQEYLKPSK